MNGQRRKLVATTAALCVLGALIVFLKLIGTTTPDVVAENVATAPPADVAAPLPIAEAAPDPIVPEPAKSRPPVAKPSPAIASAPPVAAPAPPETSHLLVVDRDSQPVAGALVETLRRTSEAHPDLSNRSDPTWDVVASTHTNASGRCGVTLAPETDAVIARADGVGSSGLRGAEWLAASRNGDGEDVLILMPRIELSGLVLDADDKPVPGATVRIRSSGADGELSGPPMPAPELTTGSDGRFAASVDYTQQCSIGAVAPDGRSGGVVKNPRPGVPLDVVIRFAGEWIIEGFVQDTGGRVVSGATVVAQEVFDPEARDEAGFPKSLGPTIVSGLSLPDGSFRLILHEAGAYEVSAVDEVFAPAEARLVTLSGPSGWQSVILVLGSFGKLSGWVVSPVLDPLPIFRVQLRAVPPTVVDIPRGGGSGLRRMARPSLLREKTTKANADGRFEFASLPANGQYQVRALLDRPMWPAQGDAPWVEVPRGASDIVIVASERAIDSRSGVLVVSVSSTELGGPPPDCQCFVVEEGSFAFGFPWPAKYSGGVLTLKDLDLEKHYTLLLVAQGLPPLDLHDVVPTRDGTQLKAVIPKPASLEVEVLDEQGRPVSAAIVKLQRSFPLGLMQMLWNPAQPGTDVRGVARVEKLVPGHYTASVEAAGGKGSAKVDVVDGQFARLRVLLTKE